VLKPAFLFFLLIIFIQIFGQNSKTPVLNKYITNYSEKDYGAFNAQNWSVCQDSNGLMYFGNSYNVLTYNGTQWKNIPIKGQANYVISLFPSSNNRVFWGSTGDLGVIETDIRGKKNSRSLASKLPELDRYFSEVWRTYQLGNEIVFFTQESIFLYNPEKDTFRIIYPEESFHLAFVVKNQLFARDRAFGLKKFDGNNFIPVPGGDVFHNEGIFGMFPMDNGKILIVTQQIGLFVYDPRLKDNTIMPLKSPDTEFLNQQQIIGGIQLIDGHIALNTASNGVIIINNQGNVIQRINISSGIADNDVKHIYQDNYENLWLATNNGISRVNYSSNISFYLNDERTGLFGSVNALAKSPSALYVGTTTGLYSFDIESNIAFNKFPEINENISALCTVGDALFIGTADALYLMSKGVISKLASMDARVIKYSKQKKVVYAVGSNGLFAFDEKKSWSNTLINREIAINSIGAAFISDVNFDDHLWVGSMSQGLWNITINKNFEITTEVYQDVDGEPRRWVIPYFMDDKVVASTPSGLWKLVTREEIKKQMDDTANLENITPYFLPADIPSLDSGIVSYMTHYGSNYWMIYNGVVGEYGRDQILNTTPYLSLDVGKINTLLVRNDSALWIGSNGGLTSVDLSENRNYNISPDIKINELNFSNDSVLFYSTGDIQAFEIDYKYNSFTIRFSSIYSENGTKPLYSYKLEGYDDDWSSWSSNSYATYKKIHEGKYQFTVRAKNVYQTISQSKTLTLNISSPWYRTTWAYLAYLTLITLFILGIVRAYTYRLKQKNIQLEAIIVKRTKEILKQKDEIEKQRDIIKEVHEEIKSSIAYAKRIQTAVLPSKEFENPFIKDYFIFFKPKDIVSGDFYWAKKSGNFLIMAVADCTGHGVPGAFMSMLGISLLNEIVGKNKVTQPAMILNQLREGVVMSLKQRGDDDDQKDGMDISLVSINLDNGELQWSGAHNPLFVFSKEKPNFQNYTSYKEFESDKTDYKLFELKPDKMPIAISMRMTEFSNHSLMLKPDDIFYMFSDGYIDQFGGPKGKKFMIRTFRNTIFDIVDNPLDKQRELLNNRLENWMNFIDPDTQSSYNQIDDVCVMGIKI
jgi:serine phosphatase RsbU (regulator of sigma subunit)/ligand-binding sensor domain-containing protein